VLESYAKELSDKLFKANMKYWNESDKLKNEHRNKIHQMLYTI